MIVTISLDEDEQELLLSCDIVNEMMSATRNPHWVSIAGKIRKAQDGSPWEVPPLTEENAHPRKEAMRLYRQKSTHRPLPEGDL